MSLRTPMKGAFVLLALSLVAAPEAPAPTFAGDPSAESRLAQDLATAFRGTQAYGAWPAGSWTVHLHSEAGDFDKATGAPRQRAAIWVGSTLHLRPWEQLRRRALGPLLRHELTHRRLLTAALPRWEEEARCLFAETHPAPPTTWAPAPPAAIRSALDRALASGTTEQQAWAYRCLRAWLAGKPLPPLPHRPTKPKEAWSRAALPAEDRLCVRWPPERMPRDLVVNGNALPFRPGIHRRFTGRVRFGAPCPVEELRGLVELKASGIGWELRWTCSAAEWVAAATEGELGREAPAEARRALAGLLARWLQARSPHPDGSYCPLTHCAVIRGSAHPATQALVLGAPRLDLPPDRLFFCGSKGGVSLSPREVWGTGPSEAPPAEVVPGDRWAHWSREFSAAEVNALKGAVPPGLKAGQRGIALGQSGPYAIEALRLEAGRRFGWHRWPSNACEAQLQPGGGLRLRGKGWGHNVGLCLTSAQHQARLGWTAETILEAAFGPGVCSNRASR